MSESKAARERAQRKLDETRSLAPWVERLHAELLQVVLLTGVRT
jgi:hypothetical protein